LLLPISSVVHHYFAGFGGGRKLLVPGAAGRETIVANHRLVFRPAAEGAGRHPGAAAGRLTGNPVHEDLAEAVRMIDLPIFLLASIRGNRPGAFAGFWAGDLFQAHAAACRSYLGWKAHAFERPYDLVLSASGGHPLDANLIQAHKGLDSAFRLVRPGGCLVHVAECGQGLGAAGLESWLAVGDRVEHARRLQRDYSIYAQTLLAIRDKAAAVRIGLVSQLPDEVIAALGMHPAHSLEDALAQVLELLPPAHTTAWFPDAGALLPVRPGEGPLVDV
jgi:nickel-dependent lactate racemase